MLRVAARVAIQPVSHVNQLFGNNDFQRTRPGQVDSREVDQDAMFVRCRVEAVGAAYRRSHSSTEPRFEDSPLGGHTQMIDRKGQEFDVFLEMALGFRVIDVPSQCADLQGLHPTTQHAPPWTLARGVRFIIAYRRLDVRARRPGSPMSSSLQRPHVLIVSDDPDLSSFLGEGLIYAGFWTSVIASALQVLEVFRLRSFDAVVVDAALGGIGASELLRRLRSTPNRAASIERTDVPLLVVAATLAEIDASAVVEGKLAAVLVAPFEISELARAIHDAVATWRDVHPERPWADEAALGN